MIALNENFKIQFLKVVIVFSSCYTSDLLLIFSCGVCSVFSPLRDVRADTKYTGRHRKPRFWSLSCFIWASRLHSTYSRLWAIQSTGASHNSYICIDQSEARNRTMCFEKIYYGRIENPYGEERASCKDTIKGLLVFIRSTCALCELTEALINQIVSSQLWLFNKSAYKVCTAVHSLKKIFFKSVYSSLKKQCECKRFGLFI